MGKPIGELLVEAKALTRERLEEALRTPREPGKKIGQVLLERGFVNEAQLTQTLSFQLSVPWVSLYHIDFSRQLLSRVPREIAERHCLVPIYVRHVKGSGETLYVAIEDPTDQTAMAEASKAAQLPVRPMIASPTDIRSAIRVYYGGTTRDDHDLPAPPAAVPEAKPESKPDTKPEAKADAKSAGAPPPLPPKRKAATTEPNLAPSASAALAQVAAAAPNPPLAPPAPPSPPRPAASSHPAHAAAPVPPPPETPQVDHAHHEHVEAEDNTDVQRDSYDAAPEVEAREITMPGKRGPRMVALTLLDGTSLQLPARPRKRNEPAPPSQGGLSDQLTSRDLISALRALSHGADVNEILGDNVHWEAMFAALLSLLLKKGIIADWEFIDELRKV